MLKQDKNYLLGRLFEGVYVVDKNRKIIFWNKGSESITGYSQDEMANKHCFDNILDHVDEDGNHLCHNGCPLHHTIQTGEPKQGNVFLRHKDGYRVPVSVRTIPIYDGDSISGAIEVFTDSRYNRDTLLEHEQLKVRTTTDHLTQIYNRSYVDYQLDNVVLEASSFQQSFGLLFIDVDSFKPINDQYGHETGDQILKLVANTIQSNIRTNDVFGRWGGDEFVLIARNADIVQLKKVANKLRTLVEKSVLQLKDHATISVTLSIGGTIYKQGQSKADIIQESDQLMYHAKQLGKNKVVIK